MAHQTTEHAIALANAQGQYAEAQQVLGRAAQEIQNLTAQRDLEKADKERLRAIVDKIAALPELPGAVWEILRPPQTEAATPADSEGGETP